MNEPQSKNNLEQRLLAALPLVLLLAVFFVLTLRRAWLNDDAYITFRTVDNLVNGYRLTWNVTERVQAYTHPLWMFLISIFYFFTREIYFTAIFVSLGTSLIAAGLLAFGVTRSRLAALLGLSVLVFSNAYVDYATSGLENPLSHLLLILFLMLWLREDEGMPRSLRHIFLLSLLASLAAVNRMDTLLLYAFPLLLVLWQAQHKKRALGMILLGQLPFILWEVFSLVYYGFLFPNTAYAKLNTGIPGAELWGQGFFYLLDSLERDPLSLAAVFCGLSAALLSRRKTQLAVALGMAAYLLYTVKIGGDFMSGRFLTPLVLAAAALLAQIKLEELPRWIPAALFATVIGLGLAAPMPTFKTEAPEGYSVSSQKGVTDERTWYFQDAGLIHRGRSDPYPASPGRVWGLQERARAGSDLSVLPVNHIGVYGYYAGPHVHAIDAYALTDPLLARLPAQRDLGWYVGHFKRSIPDGYVSSIYSKENRLTDPELAQFYDKLVLITRAPLFAPGRFQAIWEMNTGQYNHFINIDRYRYPDRVNVSISELQQPKASLTQALEFGDSGIQVSFDQNQTTKNITLSLDSDADYEISFLKADMFLSRVTLAASYEPANGLMEASLAIPASATGGFDTIRILTTRGDGSYRLGALTVSP